MSDFSLDALNSPWPRIQYDVRNGEHIAPERLADAIRAEGVPDAMREFVADELLGKHKRPSHRPVNDETQRRERAVRIINLENSVTWAWARHKIAGNRGPKERAYADVARGDNLIGDEFASIESLKTQLRQGKHELSESERFWLIPPGLAEQALRNGLDDDAPSS